MSVLAGMMLLQLSGSAAAATPAAPAPSLRARLSDDVIRQAVRETLAENRGEIKPAPSGQVLSGDQYQAFSRKFTHAQKPSCLRPDALRHQPSEHSTKDWYFSASGTLALPFLAAAIVRGKCQ